LPKLERITLPGDCHAWVNPDWSDREGLLALIAQRKSCFHLPGAAIHKDDPASRVATIPVNERAYIVKHYRRQPFRRELGRALRRSKALHSYEMAVRLGALGIPTFRPAAVVTEPFGCGLRRGAYLITEALPGRTARQFFADPTIDASARAQIAGEMVSLLQRLHAAGWVHGDAKDNNFLIDTDGVHLVDFDETARPRLRQASPRRKDWRQLMHNWRADPATAALFLDLIPSTQRLSGTG
jgi:tRNA A-37 threonylcarbamoyl transferase component Bud32